MKSVLSFFALLGVVLTSNAASTPAPAKPQARLAASLNPVSPATLCDRFIKENDQSACREKAEKLDLDWYAASICDMIENDEQFLGCWADVDGKIFSPIDLVECMKDDLDDSSRRDCVKKVSRRDLPSNRMPASEKGGKKNGPVYQPLKLGK